jgi:predicted transcriptional regulator
MRRDSLKLGPLEMEVVGLLSSIGACSVHQLQGSLEKQGRKLAYTTVMTILSRLFEKGYLNREKQGRQYFYSVAQKTEKAREGIFSTIYQSLFKSDRLRPIANFINETEDLSEAELQELKKLVHEKLKGIKEKP